MEKVYQVLDYLAMHSDTKVHFQAFDMVLNIHSDTLYLTEPKVRSPPFFMGPLPKDGKPIKLNGTFYMLSSIL